MNTRRRPQTAEHFSLLGTDPLASPRITVIAPADGQKNESGSGIPDMHTGIGAHTVLVQYCRPLDEFVATFEEATQIEIFEPLEDLELVFDATETGSLLGLVLRGARLNRPDAWLNAVQTILGPSLWSCYQRRAFDDAYTLVGDDSDDDQIGDNVQVRHDEWRRLRWRTWWALHESLHLGQWWVERGRPSAHAELPTDGADEPWVVTTARPRPGGAANLRLPDPLAEICGLHPTGYVRRTPCGLTISFDIENDECRATNLILQLAGPATATGLTRRKGDEVTVDFETPELPDAPGLLVVVAERIRVGGISRM